MSLISPQLVAFLAVAKHGTVHGAALAISLTQTGVTQRLKALDTQLNVGLFERSRKGMRLTAEGQALLRYCQKVLELEGETLALFDGGLDPNVRPVQRLSIAGPSSLMRARIIPRMKEVVAQFPNLRLTFDIEDSYEKSVAKLRGGEVQLAVLPPEFVAREMDSKVLQPEIYGLAVPKAWKSRTLLDIVRSEVLIDFEESDETSFHYLKLAGLRNEFQGVRHFVNNTDALAAMIELGMGYSVLGLEFAADLLTSGSMVMMPSPKPYQMKFAIAWYPRSEMSAYFKGLIQAMR